MILSLLNTLCILYLQHTSVQVSQISSTQETHMARDSTDRKELQNEKSRLEENRKEVIPRKTRFPHCTSWSRNTLYTVMDGTKFQV